MTERICVRLVAMVFLTIFILMFCGCGLLPDEETAAAPPLVKTKRTEYELYKVTKKDIAKSLKYTGTFIAEGEKNLYFRLSGQRLKNLNVLMDQEVKKGDLLAMLDDGDIENRLRMQENQVKKLEIQLEQLKKKYEKYSSLPKDYQPPEKEMEEMKTAVNLQEIDLDNAKVQYDSLKKEYDSIRIVSPIDGKVVFVESLAEGDAVEAYKTVITVADKSKLLLHYKADYGLEDIRTGMQARVTYEGKDYQGVVVLSPDNVPKDAKEKFANSVAIRVDNLPNGVGLGKSADFVIDVQTKKDVLVIPRKALKTVSGRDYVFIMEGNEKREADIEKGIESTYDIEIRSGLSEGQMVILN